MNVGDLIRCSSESYTWIPSDKNDTMGIIVEITGDGTTAWVLWKDGEVESICTLDVETVL